MTFNEKLWKYSTDYSRRVEPGSVGMFWIFNFKILTKRHVSIRMQRQNAETLATQAYHY